MIDTNGLGGREVNLICLQCCFAADDVEGTGRIDCTYHAICGAGFKSYATLSTVYQVNNGIQIKILSGIKIDGGRILFITGQQSI